MHRLVHSRFAYWYAFVLGAVLCYVFAELTRQFIDQVGGLLLFLSMLVFIAPVVAVDIARKNLKE